MDRKIANILISRLNNFRAVALLGPRQVGKSYLLKEIIKHHNGTLLSFDDPMERAEAAKDPLRFLKQRYSPGKYLFIDEAAKVPEIFSAVKILIDENDPKPTGICLANSGNYLLLRRIKETLAGRVNLLPIFPLSWQELAGSSKRPGLLDIIEDKLSFKVEEPFSIAEINRNREERILWGGYPFPSLSSDRDSKIIWVNDYVRTYILPLVVEQFNIRDIAAFDRAAQILFTQSGQFFNASKLAQVTGVSQPTAADYAYFLKAMMVVEFVNSFLHSPFKRLIKQPKAYAIDPILLHQPLGTGFSTQLAMDRKQIGHMYETFIFNEMQKTLANYGKIAGFYSWRTQDKAEVDIILSTADGAIPFEVKWSSKLSKRDVSGLQSFLRSYPEVKNGYVIYTGEHIKQLSQKIAAIPDWWLLGSY